MHVRTSPPRARFLTLEEFEPRTLLNGAGFTVPLSPGADQFGDQILTVQAYADSSRVAFGIFDTGSSAITFSEADQSGFIANGRGIPIKTPGGAHAVGLGGPIVGDVSEPNTILADGIHAAQVSFDELGVMHITAAFGPGSTSAPGIQAFVGTNPGSEFLPTITGTPIFSGWSQAALIDFRGAQFDFSTAVPGMVVNMPDLRFVSASTTLTATPESSPPITVPLEYFGQGTGGNPGTGITEAPNPVQPNVDLVLDGAFSSGQRFLFDTGAQMTVISPATAKALGIDLFRPDMTVGAQGVSGAAGISGYVLDSLTMPSDIGPLRFENVPVFVAEVAQGLDGILGTNLFNRAIQMLYRQTGSPSVTITFELEPGHFGPEVDQQTVATLQGLDVPFASELGPATLPTFVVASGEAAGQIFQDLNLDSIYNPHEPGLSGQLVFIDLNHNGTYEQNEPQTRTDASGEFLFTGLAPGTYTIQPLLPAELESVNPMSAGLTIEVSNHTTSADVNIAVTSVSTDEATALVNGLYGTLLQRAPDAFGRDYWTKLYQSGMPSQAIARSIWESAEHRALQVDGYYQRFLGRFSDPVGQAYWVGAFQQGASEAVIQQGFLGSAEYASAHQGDQALVAALYQDALGRPVDDLGMLHWQKVLQSGASKAVVAKGILTSAEAYRRGVDELYSQILSREADSAGREYWTYLLQNNHATWNSVAASFLSSLEYMNKMRERINA